ncbi:hypothetical protein [Rathayibacter tritici]|uniref:hypothetical protein n=1 Tax=Rathayibacter tritici TaxID=33888 RepID=UPI0014762A61|nr:hypothetical protein [Rathayibacter tritici]
MTDRLKGPVWMKVLGAFLLLSFGGMVALAVVLVDAIGAVPATLTMLPSVLVLAVGLVLITASVRVDVARDIELRFVPIWRRRLEFSELQSVGVEDQTWFRFGGVGLRWRGNATGLILGNRPALLLRTRGNREYVVQCRHPERVADLIHARMGAR